MNVVDFGIIGETDNTEDEDEDDVLEDLLVAVTIAVVVMLGGYVEQDSILLLDTVELVSFGALVGICTLPEIVLMVDCVAVSTVCVMGLEFCTPSHTLYTATASA